MLKKMVQQLKVLVLVKDAGLIPSIYHRLQLQFQGIWHTLLASRGTKHSCGAHRFIKTKQKSKAMIRGVWIAWGKRDEAWHDSYRSSVDHVGKAAEKPAGKGHQPKEILKMFKSFIWEISMRSNPICWGLRFQEASQKQSPVQPKTSPHLEGSAGMSTNHLGKTIWQNRNRNGGGLNEIGYPLASHYWISGSPVGGIAWGSVGGLALMEKAQHWRWDLRVLSPSPTHRFYSFCFMLALKEYELSTSC